MGVGVCARMREHASMCVCSGVCAYKCPSWFLNRLGTYMSVCTLGLYVCKLLYVRIYVYV